MSDSILGLQGAATQNSAGIGATLASQQLNKAVMARLLASIEQAGQTSVATPPNRVDRVQISAEAQQKLASDPTCQGCS